MKQLSGVRKADKAHGDDTTLTRFVKMESRHSKPSTTALTRADATGTRFPTRVLRVSDMSSLLVSGHSNIKLGRDVRKGHLRGYWIYSLSLEERKTCPSSCLHWQSCYGNNMPFAKRIDHTDAAFLPALEAEIAALCVKHKGVLIRLHALGDFYSVDYVEFWDRMLRENGNLALFGYTARDQCAIGVGIRDLHKAHGDRAMIRYSNGGYGSMSTISVVEGSTVPENSFACPEQTGKTKCCATCAACWSTTKNVTFMEH